MWILASSCSSAAGPTQEDLWKALSSNRNLRSHKEGIGAGCFWPQTSVSQTAVPNLSKINEELDRVFKDVKKNIPEGTLGIILASTKGFVEDIVWQSEPASVDPLGPVLNEFISRHALCPDRAIAVSNACASFHAAVYLANLWLKRKSVDHVLVIAVDAIGPFVWNGFQSLGLIASENCRPFSHDRDGLQLGEAAAAFVFSSQIKSDIEIESVAIDTEGAPVSRPTTSGESLRRVITSVLQNIKPHAIPNVILAHGTGTKINDQIEDQVLSELFSNQVPITANKWCVGHTLGASGAVDMASAIEILRRQQVFAIGQTNEVDQRFSAQYVTAEKGVSNIKVERVLINSLGFGGTHGAICLRRGLS